MTSWQDPPLTRREARERERLLAQQAASSTPDAPAAAPAPAPQPPAPAPQPPAPAPQPTQSPAAWQSPPAQAPQPQPAPQAAPPSMQPPQSWQSPPAAPPQYSPPPAAAPAAPPAPPVRPTPEPAPQPPRESAPERTLTRRELRALLESQGQSTQDELDAPSLPPAPPARQAPAPERSASPVAMTSHRGVDPAPAPSFESAAPETPAPAPASSTPTGHWSLQMAEDEPESPTPFDQLLARGGAGSGGSTTTNALILPSLPNPGAMMHPATGEVMVTGSIDLPRSYGSTGAHPSHIDSPDLDSMFDQMEDTGGGVAPISAARAISTQTSQRGVISPPKKEGMNVPLVLAVTAGVLALGVVGTLVAGYALNLF
ncbi:hypothetical protein ARHIZOSPH14_31250 [Agromyces rhizosphaerae]|uniref:Uncharacterized protein n=1 Tax=Agromyces rhizosphaerae TaxID=88374 RepID=A0A9W6D3C6_9MICO|nr:hypothetical protein [Agromyces rhizosphaerae]GLI28883.1 hypothetical protein ARHIZOSPH14_31250 [Agromyces rhizosphaerae]